MKEVRELTDEQLFLAHRAGEVQAFQELVNRYYKELYRFMMRYSGQATLAEDLVQETFLQVHRSAGTFDPKRRFKAWMFTIAANKARDAFRKQARRPMLELDAAIRQQAADSDSFVDMIASTEPMPEEKLIAKETQQMIRQLLDEMSEPLREIIILAYYHHFPYKQIGEILDIPLGTVKSRLHTAVAQLAKLFKQRVSQ